MEREAHRALERIPMELFCGLQQGSLKDLSKTLKCNDNMCVMEVVKYGQSEADNSG